jgi:hypothetical protein
MQMRYRYRIEPTPAQQAVLARVFGWCSTTHCGSVMRRIGLE